VRLLVEEPWSVVVLVKRGRYLTYGALSSVDVLLEDIERESASGESMLEECQIGRISGKRGSAIA